MNSIVYYSNQRRFYFSSNVKSILLLYMSIFDKNYQLQKIIL